MAETPSRPGGILVIDDDERVRSLVQRALEPSGTTVRLAAGGREGLELALREPPALVLLDLGMPDLDGWQVLSELRAHPETADVPVALLTGANDCASYTRSREHEVAAFISKPFRLAELAGLCRRLIQPRLGGGGSEWLSGGEVTDERGLSLGSCVVLDRDDDGAMLELEHAPRLGDRLTLGSDQGKPSAGEVRWVRAVGQRFHVGMRLDR